MPIRLLHFSDTHVDSSSGQAAMGRTEAMVAACGGPVDGVLFSGDATASGTAAQFELFRTKVLTPVLEGLAVPPTRFFVAPGNHDVDRSRISPLIQVQPIIGDPDKADALWSTPDQHQLVMPRLAAFDDFCASAGVTRNSGEVRVGTASIGIACVNSSWTSSSKDDRHNIVITRAQFVDAIDSIQTSDVRIALWHHPLSWLEDRDATRIQEQAIAHLDLFCVGHFHDEAGMGLHSPFGHVRQFQAPALYSRGALSGFLIYEADGKSITARCFRWDDKRAVFVPNPEFAPNGEWTFALEPRGALTPRSIAVHNKVTSALRNDIEARLDRHLPAVASVSGRLAVDDRFVAPNLVTITSAQTKHLRVRDLLLDSHSFVITGERHAGKSTLLDYVGAKLNATGHVAVPLRFSRLREHTGRAGLVALLASTLHQSKSQAERLLHGPLVLLVDDADAGGDTPEWQVLHSWLDFAPDIRVVLGCRTVGGIPTALKQLSSRWRVASLQPMTLRHIRTELTRIQAAATDASRQWNLEKALDVLVEAELPRWPWALLMLFELSRRGKTVDISNIPSLLRLYVELRLGAFDIASSEAARVSLRMLRLLAADMAGRHDDSIDRGRALSAVGLELAAAGIEGAAEAVLDALLRSGVIVEEPTGLSFAFIILQEFFHSEHLRENQWRDPGSLDSDSLIRMSGALAFLAEAVHVPGLVDKALEIAKSNAPCGAVPLKLDHFAALGELLEHTDPELSVAAARGNVPCEEEVDTLIEEKENSKAGTRKRRLKQGQEGLAQLNIFWEALFTAVALLRSSMWLDLAKKVEATQTSINMTATLVSEMALNEEVIRYLSNEAGARELGTKLSAFMNALLLLIVGSALSTVGAARHLSSAIRTAFDVETDELKRFLLLMWYTEIDGAESDRMTRAFADGASSLAAIQLVEVWVTIRFVNALAFGNASAAEQEQLLRYVVTERIRKSTSRRDPGFVSKMAADQVVQHARALRRTAVNS